MKRVRKRQLLFLSANLLVLLLLFVSLRFYDRRFGQAPPVYERPRIDMEKTRPGDNPLFPLYDKMDLFSRYRGTRAVGSVRPETMVILIPRAGYEGDFPFSRLLSEAAARDRGLVVMDLSEVRHFIPLEGEGGLLENDERMVLFVKTMASYMGQYGYVRFPVLFLGMDVPPYLEGRRIDDPELPVYEETLIDRILGASP